ncbi:MAG: glycosyltransferase [Bacteroidota bacterium]|nr:glycosyltransferase [Bacteroidota bacterium]
MVILPRIPYPLEKGDKLRAFNHVKVLSKNNDIHLVCLNDSKVNKQDAFQAVQPYVQSVNFIDLSLMCRILNLMRAFISGKPLQVGYFYSRKAHRKIKRIIRETGPDHIFCQLLRTAEYARYEKIPKTLDYQDVFSKGVQRRITGSAWYLKAFLRLEYRRLLAYENQVFDYFNNKVIISKPDRSLIPHPEKEKIAVIINGVDTDFFKPMSMEKKYDLVFTGNMAYPPNVNAVEYIAYKLLPLLQKRKPGIRILIAGATPDKRVKAVESGNIHVSGWVDDIRESYASARIFIAPMQIGTGLQNKLLEAMAMKIPSITSAMANKALEAVPGKEILIGELPASYADHIVRLLDDQVFADKIAENAYDFVHRKYNWESATAPMEEMMKNT